MALDWQHPRPSMLEVYIQTGLIIALYKRSLLLVESFDLCISNHYGLVMVIPSSLHFAYTCLLPGKFPVKLQPKILDTFILRKLFVYMEWWNGGGGSFSSCDECDVNQFGSFVILHPSHIG
jgi:hypothetical protein